MTQILTSLRAPRPISASLVAADSAAAKRTGLSYTDALLTAQTDAAWAQAAADTVRADQAAVRQAQSETAWVKAELDAARAATADRDADLADMAGELAELRQRVLDVETERDLAIFGLRGQLNVIELGARAAEQAA